jgi:hypothetical protein
MGDNNIDGDGGGVDEDGGGVDGDGSGGKFPIPAGCRNRDFCPPKFVFDGGSAAELFVDGGWTI